MIISTYYDKRKATEHGSGKKGKAIQILEGEQVLRVVGSRIITYRTGLSLNFIIFITLSQPTQSELSRIRCNEIVNNIVLNPLNRCAKLSADDVHVTLFPLSFIPSVLSYSYSSVSLLHQFYLRINYSLVGFHFWYWLHSLSLPLFLYLFFIRFNEIDILKLIIKRHGRFEP